MMKGCHPCSTKLYIAYRPLPHHYQMDYDWEPPITVIPDSQPEEDDWPEPLSMIPDSEDGRESQT
jgi:hypothetical protein